VCFVVELCDERAGSKFLRTGRSSGAQNFECIFSTNRALLRSFFVDNVFFVMKFYHNIAPIDRAQNMWDTYVLQTDCSSGAFLLITFFFVMKFYHNIAPIDRAQNMWDTYVLQTDCSSGAFCR